MEDHPRLYKETVSATVLGQLTQLMQLPALADFRLAGGTALALYQGHRLSIDLDLFAQRSFPVRSLIASLTQAFPNVIIDQVQSHGISAHWQNTKVDLYYMGAFLYPVREMGGIRLADIRDIAAMKIECILSRKERKDYHDIVQLLQDAPLSSWIAEFQKKYPYYQTRAVVDHLLAASQADESLIPQLLDSPSWDQVKEKTREAVETFLVTLKEQTKQETNQRDKKLKSLIAKKRKK